MKNIIALIVSLAIGLVIWKIDSQPTWDDSGITAGMIVLSTGLISFISPHRPYVCALAVTVWIPLFGIIVDRNYGTLLVLLFGFIGAYGGATLRGKVTT
jgi:hypothetical protein